MSAFDPKRTCFWGVKRTCHSPGLFKAHMELLSQYQSKAVPNVISSVGFLVCLKPTLMS
jgi:hypothetical protein